MNKLRRMRRLISLYVKRRRLQKARKIYSQTKVSDNLSKTVLSEGAHVELNSKTTELIKQVKQNVDSIAEQTLCDPQKLLEYINAAKTQVYYIPNAKKLLKNIGESDGFIPEKTGIEAFYLSVITFSGLKFHTEDMFVFGNSKPEKYLVLYNFYKWFSKKSGLSGFEPKIQKLFKKYYKNASKLNTKGLSLSEIVGLQDAISRDNEAIDYTLNYEKTHEVSKKAADKISKDKGANI